ncbi:MAG: N-acetylmuramoyl-L-alanine amidase [Oscillospiraceae bacterium]|nr:N-acetylmuramoyl-L-alanine amidase [Oscillospiraceae bacterium]
MSDLFKSKRKIALAISAVFLALTIATGTIAWVLLEGSVSAGYTTRRPAAQEREEAPPEVEAQPDYVDEWDEPAIEEEDDFLPVSHSFPAEMRGVFLVPGQDFLRDPNASADALRAEVDAAINDAKNLTMNTVVIQTRYEDRVIFNTMGAPQVTVGFDLLDYIITRARAEGLFVYTIFDASLFEEVVGPQLLSVNAGTISRLSANLREFARNYAPDAILIDGYTRPVEEEGTAFIRYLTTGGAIGFQNYLRQSPTAVVTNASRTIRNYAPGIRVGILADAVWENESENPGGSQTSADFTALSTGNADTKSFVEDGLIDFVAVQAFASLTDPNEPFGEVVSWWGDLADNHGIPMYVVHASSNIATQNPGWAPPDQLTQQVIRAGEVPGVSGSIFNSLGRLAENPQDATSALIRFYQGQVSTQHILTELAIVSPAQTTFVTHEPSVAFTGASDPNFPITLNGREISRDSNGYFTVSMELNAGLNTFTFEHKARTITYNITRNIEILREIAPTGTITTDGNMLVSISAIAYEGATVSARFNGQTIPMQIDTDAQDEDARVSHFSRFVGQITTPPGTQSEQNLGAITITASWNGHSESMTGASVRVNRRVPVSDGVPVVVIADQAATFPPNTLNNIPSPSFFPIPRGAMDFAVGDEITYTSRRGNTYRYRVLASGLRVLSSDIQAVTNDFLTENVISGFNITTEGRRTYLTVNTSQRVTYGIRYTGSEFIINFAHTGRTPGGSAALNQNPLFTNARWDGSSLILTLARNGGFLGYRADYDANGNLVFRFNTPPSSLSGARIAIDPGHGGNDPGALGFLQAFPERVINQLISQMLADELRSRGANVLLIDHSSNPSLQNRVAQAERFDADFLVSVHNNASTRAAAAGTETFYFYTYGRNAATAISRNVASALNTTNRGARQSFYHITLSAQVPSILVEAGFMTNKAEYEKLIQERYQRAIAIAIADGLAAGISAASTGANASGSQNVGNATGPSPGAGSSSNAGNRDEDDDYRDDSDGQNDREEELEEIYFVETLVTLFVGESATLEFLVFPNNSPTAGIRFASDDTSVATVDANGRVTGVSEGVAVITISDQSGRITDYATIEVWGN